MASKDLPPTSLKHHLRTRIISSVLRDGGTNHQKVLILDSESMSILNSAMKTHQVIDENITLIEHISKSRQPFPIPALYLVTPTKEIVDMIIKDFSRRGPPLYKAAHLYFTAALPDTLFKRIQSSPAKPYMRTCKELFIDFQAFESNVFNFHLPLTFNHLYAQNSLNIGAELALLSKKLTSVCATLGEYPIIRYAKPNGIDKISGRLASLLQDDLDELAKIDNEYPVITNIFTLGSLIDQSKDRPRATMLITDRSIDAIAPLLHEFTYQAMANDVLPIVDGKKYRSGGDQGGKDHFLDDNDEFWVTLRHSHIAEVISKLITDFNNFLVANKAASASKSKGGVASIQEMKATMAALPQFQELKDKFSFHIGMSQDCMSAFDKLKLAISAAVEQELATGETAEGHAPKNIIAEMVPLLSDKDISNSDKLRLIILFIIHKQGVQDADRRQLLDHAKITAEEITAITNIALLGVRLSKSTTTTAAKPKSPTKKAKKRADDVPYELSRYVPLMKSIIEGLANGSLSKTDYPFVKEAEPTAQSTSVAPAKSLRTTKPSWATADKNKSEVTAQRSAVGRIMIFVAGGVTYSELRTAYEASASINRDVIIGASSLLTPNEFIDGLKGLSRPMNNVADLKAAPSKSSLDENDSKGRREGRRSQKSRPEGSSRDNMKVQSPEAVTSPKSPGGILGWFKK